MVQRTLAAKNMAHAKGGAVFASFLKLVSFAMFTIPGMASRALVPGESIRCLNCIALFSFLSQYQKG